ncbi:MAG: hypothetical protein A2W33_00030 [Chloroflexi bacterium RBG_16_52_11]|nr:MAG: hypothetical protein A2W33_00030 [Chloroflexi bacterium RBG_16_52_11]
MLFDCHFVPPDKNFSLGDMVLETVYISWSHLKQKMRGMCAMQSFDKHLLSLNPIADDLAKVFLHEDCSLGQICRAVVAWTGFAMILGTIQ